MAPVLVLEKECGLFKLYVEGDIRGRMLGKAGY